jgi:16S rRNA (cytidine1402-2'-O)-methyltransferase
MLYLVATPIGNLADITYRAIEILKACDYILCEDTRHSLRLLQHYEIHKPLKSYHKFNEAKRERELIDDLKSGLKLALISDAGTPGIADPGSKLVQSCLLHQIPVQAIPGPCAAIAALTSSGLDTERFQFVSFLPRKKGELTKLLQELLIYRGTSICYESPHRLVETLKLIEELAPERSIVLARELTKKFEEFRRGTALELLRGLKKIKGEIILLISPPLSEQIEDWSSLSIPEHVQQIEERLGLTRQEAIKAVAELRKQPKRLIYRALLS